MSNIAIALGSFFGVGSTSDGVIEQWRASEERKIKNGRYGLHMDQSVMLSKTSREKVVASADKVLNTISTSLLKDKEEEEMEEDSSEEEESDTEEETNKMDDGENVPAEAEPSVSHVDEKMDVAEEKDLSGETSKTATEPKILIQIPTEFTSDVAVKTGIVTEPPPSSTPRHRQTATKLTGGKPKHRLTDAEPSSDTSPGLIQTPTEPLSDIPSPQQTVEEIKPLDQSVMEEDFVYGKDAMKHYKFFTMIENKRKKAMLKEQFVEKQAEYDWKLEAIDELVNLARAYYYNPHSEQGEEWRRLKRRVISRSQRKKVSETVVRHELSKLPKFKPYFTYTIIVLQVLTFAILCTFGGVTDVGTEPKLYLASDIKTFLGIETVHRWTPPNIWIGPDQRFLIGIGALYPPCMRNDYSVELMYSQQDYSVEEVLGCCEVANKNVAGTTTELECSNFTAGTGSWQAGTPCGERTSISVAHTMKPCCVDLKGTCWLLSHAHCMFMGGIFHRTGPEHCSQVNCLAGICNLGPLEATPERPWIPVNPNQWWRLPLSLLYHYGIIHVAMVTVIQWLTMRQIEETAGWFRMVLIYCLSGFGGLLTSSLFEPNTAAVGGVYSAFGMIGVMLVELSQFWPTVKEPVRELSKLIAVIIVFLVLGTLPYLDNFGILTGLIIGMLCAVILLPYVTFRRWQVKIRLIIVLITFPCLFLLMFILIYAFYKVQTFEVCGICKIINCVPYTDKICDPALWS